MPGFGDNHWRMKGYECVRFSVESVGESSVLSVFALLPAVPYSFLIYVDNKEGKLPSFLPLGRTDVVVLQLKSMFTGKKWRIFTFGINTTALWKKILCIFVGCKEIS